jgi:putative DNA methylase
VPDTAIEEGDKTIELIRNRGWTHWHHLFSPRQLLLLCKICKCVNEEEKTLNKVAGLLGLNKCVDWNSRLCRWNSGLGNEKPEQTFYNQAFNSLMNWGVRSLLGASTSWFYDINQSFTKLNSEVDILDARVVRKVCDCWVTDPPYADAVNYHELSEFFLAWDKFLLQEAFPGWYADSKRVLAVTGDDHFSQTMIDIYSNLAAQMPDDGMQVVMFTHSDPAVWAQLALIMWKAGLKVTAAWNIATETDAAGLKDGNYVKGTVLLALRKLTGDDAAFLDEINADIRTEVRRQIAQMLDLEKGEEPNFSDPDFVLAAYAASLKVLTSYKTIGDLNLDYELGLAINDPAKSSVIKIIEAAKKIAYDCVIPAGFEGYLWKDLTGAEKFYVKGLESEKRGNYKISTYQEYARGFNISGYGQLMASERANTARLKTPVEMAGRTLSDVPDFEGSLLRILFAAIFAGVKEDGNPAKALGHIKSELPDYWGARDMIKQLLDFLRDTRDIDNMAPHWGESAAMADLLYSLVDHDSI